MDVFDLFAKISLDDSGFKSGLDGAKGALSSFGGAVSKGLGTVAKVGAAAVGAATTAVTAFGAASVETGKSFDQSMSQVAATMGKSMDEMASAMGTATINGQTSMMNLRDYAQEMGRTTAFSATQAADALNYMALAGYDTQTSMDMLPNVLNLAAAGGMDLARASDMVTDTQTAFGISLERTSQMVDEMAKAASTGNTNVEQLGDAFLTVGGLAQELNGGMVMLKDGTEAEVDGVQELEIALTAMANAGVKGSEAGTHMRNMLLKLSSPTKDGAAALEAMGVSVFDAEGNMRSLAGIFGDLSDKLGEMSQSDKISVISDLFNTRDMASAEALLNAVNEDWDAIGESILNAEGAAQQMADTQLDNLAGDITLFQSALEGAQIAISDGLTPSLRQFVQFGTDGLSRITSAFKEGGITGAMDEFGNVLSDGIAMVSKMLPGAIKAGMNLLGAVGQGILDNLPQIIDASVQIINMLIEGFASSLPALLEGAMQILTALGSALIENAPVLLETAIEMVQQLLTFLAEALPQAVPAIVQLLLSMGQMLIDNLPALLEAAGEIMMGLINGFIEALPQAVSQIAELVLQIGQFLLENAPLLIDAAFQLFAALAQGIAPALPEIIVAVVDIIIAIVDALTNPDNLYMLIDAAIQIMIALMEGLLQAIPRLQDAVPKIISNLVAALVAATPQVLSAGLQLLNGILTAIVEFIPRLLGAIPALTLAMVGGLSRGISKIEQVGRDIVAGLWNGIKERWKALVEDFKGLASGLVDGIKGLFGIHSPSTVFAEIGKNIDEGFAIGIRANAGDVEEAMNSLMDIPADITMTAANAAQAATSDSTVLSQIAEILTQIRDNGQTVILEGDAAQLFRVMQREGRRNQTITGQVALA